MATRTSSLTTQTVTVSNGTVPMEETKNDALSDAVEKIVQAAEDREGSSSSGMMFDDASIPPSKKNGGGRASIHPQQFDFSGGPLTNHEIEQLGLLCASVSSSSSESPAVAAAAHGSTSTNSEPAGFASVDGDSLMLLVPMLEKHVLSAAKVDLMRESNDVLKEEGDEAMEQWLELHLPEKISIVRQGMNSASILLTIMTSPGVDPRAISEDCIEACIAVMRQHLMRNVVPAMTNTGHLVSSKRDSMSSPRKPKKVSPPPSKKLKKSTSNVVRQEQQSVKVMKKIYKPVMSSVGVLLMLMERVEGLVQSVQIDDRQVLALSSAALSTFTMDPVAANASMCHLLQVASIGMLTTVFRNYPRHRIVVIEDLFPLMLQLPTSKRSIRTYPVRSAVDLSTTRTNSPSTTGALPVRASQPRSIQAMSALILSLVQSCVIMPTMETASAETESSGEDANGSARRRIFGLQQCLSICNLLASELAKRCSRKGEDGGASEFRPVLSNLVDDLLSVQLTPEYPAAEMLLLAISTILSNDLLKASTASKSSGSHAESTYLATALDTIGKISAAMARHRDVYFENPLSISTNASDDDASSEGGDKEVNRCFCGRSELVNTFMLDCDKCHAWYHGSCLGISRDAVPKQWICDDCNLKLMVLEHTQAFADRSARSSKQRRKSGGGKEVDIDKTHIFRQLLLNYLSHLYGNTNSLSIKNAREFHISKWVRELDNLRHSADSNGKGTSLFDPVLLCDHFMVQWDSDLTRPKAGQSDIQSLPRLSEEGNARLMLALLTSKSDMAAAFPQLLGVIVALMKSPLANLRKLSVKAISQVIAADPKIMLEKTMMDAVSKRFHDDSISVREAAVALVGSYVLQTPDLANAFHGPLLHLLSDPGVSVRKRTVRIYRDILTSNSSYRGGADACAVMLNRAADPKEDDSIRDLIHSLFHELWLENGGSPIPLKKMTRLSAETAADPSAPTNVSNGESRQDGTRAGDVGVVTPVETPDDKPRRKSESQSAKSPLQLRSDMAAEQMVAVVIRTGTGEVLAALMKDLLGGFSDADKDRKAADRRKRQAAAQRHCSQLVEALIELLLVEEKRLNASGDRKGGKLVAIIRTIEVFAQASPALVMNHIDHVLPYLIADNKLSREDEEAIVCATCGIVSRLAPIMQKKDILQMAEGSIGSDLVRITKSFGPRALSSAVKALASLANHKDSEEGGSLQTKLLSLASMFYKYLSKNKVEVEFSSTSVKTHNIHRALAVMGSICRNLETKDDENTDWSAFLPENFTDVDADELSWSNLRAACYSLFSTFLSKDDVDTKCRALRAMGGIFASRPRVMLAAEQAGIVGEVMSENSHPDLQLTALNCWRDILVTEEKRVETGEAKAKMDSKEDVTVSKRISGDQDGDATLVGGVLTQHSPRLFDMTHSHNERIRGGTVGLLGDLLRQGLINPMETVPYLFALQGDVGAPHIRSSALKLLMREGERRPDMLRQRACAGVREAYKFQRQVYPNNAQVTAVSKRKVGGKVLVESIFGSVFKECIRSSRKQREGLYCSLLRLFEEEENDHETSHKKDHDAYVQKLPLLSFVTQVLAHLPYNTANDPLFIIYNITNSAPMHGAHVLEDLADLLGRDRLDETNTEEDELEQASKSKQPSRTKEASVLSSPAFDLSSFAEKCAEGYSIVLLLRLKSFLRKVYNLSETRCMEFVPDAKERIVDKCISVPDKFPTFNASFESCVQDTGNAVADSAAFDIDVLIRQYSEFRLTMRSVEGPDHVMDSDCSDESNKPPRKRGSTRKRGKKRKHAVLSSDDEDSDYHE